MAEKVIGLRIELNGFKGVITNIKQLEEELRKAKEDLTQLEIGGKNFKELQTQIARTETKLGDLRKASEGIGLEKQLEGYGKLAAGVTSSFAAAQAAVSLFGGESEAVAEAAIKAQNLLTVALAARGIEELVVGVNTTAATIATKAAAAADAIQTTSTFTLNTALKFLYTTIAANPIGALVAVIGLAVTALYAFSSSAEDGAKAQKEFNDSVNKDAAKTISNLNTLTTTINNTSLSLETRKKALKDLQAMAPAYFKNLKDEDILTGKVKISVDKLTEALIKQARARALQGRIEENTVKLLESEDLLLEAIEKRIDAEKRYNDEKNAPVVIGGGSVAGAPNAGSLAGSIASSRYTDALRAEAAAKIEVIKVNIKIEEDARKINGLNTETDRIIGTGVDTKEKDVKVTKEQTKATDAQIAAQKQLEKQLSLTENAYKETLETIKELVNVTSIKVEAPQIIQELQSILTARESSIPETLVDVFQKLGFTLNIAGKSVLSLNDDVGKLVDNFGNFYDVVREELSLQVLEQDVISFGYTVGNILNQASDMFSNGLITKEAFGAIVQITDQYKALNTIIKEIPGLEKILGANELKDFLQTQRNVAIAMGDIQYEMDSTNTVITKVDKSLINYAGEIQKQDELLSKYSENITKYYNEQYDATEKAWKSSADFSTLTKEQREDLENSASQGADAVYRLIQQIAKESALGFKEITNTIIQEENDIRAFLFQSQELKAQARAIDAVSIKNTFLNNLKMVYDFTQKENKIVIDTKKTQAQQIDDIEKGLSQKGIDISKYTEEEKLKILQYYLDIQVKATTEAETKKQEQYKKTIENINLALQTVSKAITDISSIVAQSFQIQLDRLEYEYQDTMENIVGDTKEASDKRLETEKSYQAEKAKIERAAQISALRFTLASTVAQGAQSIVSALTLPPPANIIVGALNAGITAAQVAIIQTQINDIQSRPLRRGGLLAMGGYISGASHEQGGVYAGGGYTLEGNESVINRQSTLQYSGLLSQINQSGGGRPIVVQSPMDSRLVEAIAKQKTEPIRAYVVEQDITRAQTINRRLEQLASF